MATVTNLRQTSVDGVVLPVLATGLVVLAAAASSLASASPSLTLLAGIGALLVAAVVAEAFPVPLEPAGQVSLSTVFIAGAALVYGWNAAVLVAVLSVVAVDGVHRRQPIQLAYNGASYGLAAAAAGGAAALAPDGSAVTALLAGTTAAATAFYAVNMALTTAVISRFTGQRFRTLLRTNATANAMLFAIMASMSLMLAVLWSQSPLLLAALVGPLVAVALYQRSVHRAMQAMRLALTDEHTGLGNKRHFEELLRRSLDRADEHGVPLTVLLVDVDDFKTVNDTFGHPVGDRVLAQVAGQLRRGGEAFRLGGDEFAVLLPGRTAAEGRAVAAAIFRRITEAQYEHGEAVTVSIGVATYPDEGLERTELVRVADEALYAAKGGGKGRIHVSRPAPRVPPATRLGSFSGRTAGVDAAAASVAYAALARDCGLRLHCDNVGELAGRVARRLGLDAADSDLVRLAGGVHDIGKLLVPEEILAKPGALTAPERIAVERHSEIGYRMLEALGLEPVATWVLHVHERWDGEGYPHGLAGDDIPLASRILLAADAYETMTADRAYGAKLSRERAVEELHRCAGAQFDPKVVDALREELADGPALGRALPESA